MKLADTASSFLVIPPFSSSSSNVVLALKMVDPSDAEDFKLWPPPVEKHFIDVLVENKPKGTCLLGNSRKGFEMSLTDELKNTIAKSN
ncbi:hypothetical protein SO802_011444 [Lithocarpus litseifolius]|uniref:Uncharacterized protein n=1 Tax=Lithocarpus litseifolius TaxID=425828 RepID=A0AAW2D2C1_9ROSI